MPRLLLSGGAYQSRSVIAGAQRCINLYPEANPAEGDPPVPVTHYPTPGLRRIGVPPAAGPCRMLYTASNGDVYQVVGTHLYFIDGTFAWTEIGRIADGVGLVSAADSGEVIVLCDGLHGYLVNMADRTFGQISDAAFYGSAFVAYIDTYFVFHKPGTGQFYITQPQPSFDNLTGTVDPDKQYAAFNPLDIARKAGAADQIVALTTVHRELWLIGSQTAEVWADVGAADFPFQAVPGAFIDHGCAAPASVVAQDVSVFWLSRDKQGQGIVVQGSGYQVQRISTHAIEAEFQAYERIDDAIGCCYQQQGHAFYCLHFPTANKSWAYELATKQWHELAWLDQNGGLNRHRARAVCFGYGTNLAGDWQNGTFYALDPEVFSDDGKPRLHLRTFPHLLNDGRRLTVDSLIADMQVGTLAASTTDAPPQVSLRWSDDRGATYGNPVMQSLGAAGQYSTSIKWSRLGMARDRVFELSWTIDTKTALNGAFIETSRSAS